MTRCSAEAHVLMASVYIADGDTQLAEQEYKEALRYEPKNAMAQNNYGTFLFAAGRYKEAAQHLKIAANDTSYARRGQAYENLGLTQLKLNQPAEAEQSFLRALMLNTTQPRSDLELADIYFKSATSPLQTVLRRIQLAGATDRAQSVARCAAEPRARRPGSAVELCAGAEEPVSRFAGIPSLSGSNLVSDAAAGPGAIVRAAARSARPDAAGYRRLVEPRARVIEDIETENWALLPTPAFTRGYLRAYAKLLDIDPDEVASAFEAALARGEVRQGGRDADAGRKQGRGVADVAQKHPGAVLTSAVGAVICAVLIVLWAVWPAAPERYPLQRRLQRRSIPLRRGRCRRRPREPRRSPADERCGAPVAAARDGEPCRRIGAPAAPSAKPLPAPLSSDAPGVRRITASGDDRLKFSFTQDCWVEIKDAQGGSLYSDLSKSGGTLELVGHAPFHILLGNAPAVTLAFNGERVALSPHTRNNVGTLVLGQ